MNHIMFSFLKPQICFGESTGGGGDGGGGGGAGSSYGDVNAGGGAATSAGQARAAQLRDEANAQRDAQERSDDYTPTSAELNAQLADLGATNMTDDYSIVDYSTTASGNPFEREGDNQNSLSQAVTNQLGGDTSYDNITGTDAYQLNRISPQNIDANILNPPPPPESDIVESISIREAPDSFMAPFNDPIGGGLDAGPLDVFGQDIYKPTPPVTYNSELDNSNYNEFVDTARYSGNESGTYPEAGSMDSIASNFNDEIPNDFANFTTPGNDSGTISNTNSIASNFYDDNFQTYPINDILAGEEFTTSAANVPPAPPGDEMDFVPRQGPFQAVPYSPGDEMDFVDRQGPVQAAPPAPPGDEMDFVPRQGPSPSQYDPINDLVPGEVREFAPSISMERDLLGALTPQRDPIDDILAGEVREFAPSISVERDLLGALTPSGMDGPQGIGSVSMERDLLGKPAPDAMSAGQAGALEDSLNMEIIADGQGQAIRGNENQELFKELGISNPLSLSDQPYNFDQIQNRRYGGFDTAPYEISKLALGELNEQVDIDQGFTSIPTEKEILNKKNTFIEGEGNPIDINPEGFTSESLLDSAYEKANSGRTSELTTAEQAVLFGQRGQQLNPAEMTQLAQVYQNTGKIPMTKEFQDSIIKSMRDPESISETIDGNISKTIGGKRNTRGATDAEIEAYKKANPIGQDINPNWKPFEELTGPEKFGRGVQNIITFLIKNATSGIIDFDKMNKNFSDKYLSAYQDPGQTGGQFLYGSETNDDITNDENFDRLVELSGTERGAEPILEGVMGSDGELVRGYDRYKNTIDGVEKVIDEGLQDDINVCPPGFYYDRVVESCMPIESLTDDTEAGDGPPNTIRPRPPSTPRPPTTNPTRPPVSQPISGGVTIRKPKFFRDGGSVTPNIDSFFSGMGR